MKPKFMQAVYCYFFPETRKVIHQVEQGLPDELFFVTQPAEEVKKTLEDLIGPFELTTTESGAVNLDEIHKPIIERIINAYQDHVSALKDFEQVYPTSGSSEGLFHLLTKLKVEGVEEINVLRGEYEGYAAQAQNLGMKVNIVDQDQALAQETGYWFISNPSARDGNIISNEFINNLCDQGNKVVLDLAYVGATVSHEFNASHKNIYAVVTSFSKPYGLFRFRAGGFTFTREEVPSLYGNKWFKDITRLFQALKVAEDIGPDGLYRKYRPVQEAIIKEVNE